jgi:hypothetical protein
MLRITIYATMVAILTIGAAFAQTDKCSGQGSKEKAASSAALVPFGTSLYYSYHKGSL